MTSFNYVIRFIINIFRMMWRSVFKFIKTKICWVLTFILLIAIWNRKCDYSSNYIATKSTSNPVIVWWTKNFPGTTDTRVCTKNIKCDVFTKTEALAHKAEAYLFYGSEIDIKDLPKRQPEILWGLYHEESPRNLEVLMHETMLGLFNFSATFSRYSNVPFPLQYLSFEDEASIDDITSVKYYVSTSEKNKLLNEIAPVLYLQSDCETSTERDLYVSELMKYIKVDAYGACLNNKNLSKELSEDYLNKLNDDSFLHFVAKYKFVVAIENGVCEDYVTEKFWRAIKVGSVPIYFGSPSIRDWFPNNKSAILLEDFTTPEVLSRHLKELLESDNLYEEYLEHKTKQIVTNSKLIAEIKTNPRQSDTLATVEKFECLICEKLHNKANIGINVVDKSHYNCPKPISALTLKMNPSNSWVYTWKYSKEEAEKIHKMVTCR